MVQVIKPEDIAPMMKLYLEGMSPADLSSIYGYNRTTIKALMKRKGILRTQSEAALLAISQGKKDKAIKALIEAAKTTNRFNPAKSRPGMEHPKAKSLFETRLHISRNGLVYRMIKVKETGRWKYEHRFVMEQILGRKLNKNEVVHHINGNTLDNRPENLIVMTPREHFLYHRHQQKPTLEKEGTINVSVAI